MGKPREQKSSPDSYPVGQAPWEQNSSPDSYPVGQAPWEVQAPANQDVVQEEHPEFGMYERFVAKNFANSPEAQIKYLQSRHPDLEVTTMKGQVVARKSKNEPYKVLDPSGFDWQDIPDVAYDVGSGVASGAASAVGGVAGGTLGLAGGPAAPATVPAGALAGAASAGAATSAGLEGVRQKIGQWLGVPQEMDYGQVKTQAAIGAISPALFGTGGVVAKSGMSAAMNAAEKAAIQNAQRSAVTRGIENLTPAIGQAFTGVPKVATKELIDNPGVIKEMADQGADGFSKQVHQKVTEGFYNAKRDIGQKLEQLYKETGATVDISKAKAAIDDSIAQLENSEIKDVKGAKEMLANLKEMRNKILQEEHPQIDPFGQPVLDEAGKPVIQAVELGDQVSPQKAFELQQLMKDYADNVEGFAQMNGSPIQNRWTTSVNAAKREINKGLDEATSGASGELKQQYRDFSKLQEKLKKYFGDEEKTYNTLTTWDAPGKKWMRETMKEFKGATAGATDLEKEAAQAQAYRFYENPSWTPISSGGTTSTSRTMNTAGIGGSIGYKMGGPAGQWLGYTGMQLLGGPAALKTGIKAGQLMSKAAPAVQPKVVNSFWNMQRNKEKKR